MSAKSCKDDCILCSLKELCLKKTSLWDVTVEKLHRAIPGQEVLQKEFLERYERLVGEGATIGEIENIYKALLALGTPDQKISEAYERGYALFDLSRSLGGV